MARRRDAAAGPQHEVRTARSRRRPAGRRVARPRAQLRRPDDLDRIPVYVAAGKGSAVEVFDDADTRSSLTSLSIPETWSMSSSPTCSHGGPPIRPCPRAVSSFSRLARPRDQRLRTRHRCWSALVVSLGIEQVGHGRGGDRAMSSCLWDGQACARVRAGARGNDVPRSQVLRRTGRRAEPATDHRGQW